MQNQNKNWNQALDIIIESILKPDSELRDCAREEFCYEELMTIRDQTVQYLKSLRL